MAIDFTEIIAYVTRVHSRSYEAVGQLDDAHLDWRPRPGEFTAAELVTHIANSRLMNVGTIRGSRTRYPGHEVAPGTTADDLRQLMLRTSKTTIARLSDADLAAEVTTMAGGRTPAWQILLGGLIEHEVHHRSALCEYLSAMGLQAPPLYGLHVEDLPR